MLSEPNSEPVSDQAASASCRTPLLADLPAAFLLSVVMPVFNERQTIGQVIERVRGCGLPCEIVVVDDGSQDGTSEWLDNCPPAADLRVVRQPRNLGKGAAVKRGFELSRGDVVVVQDADLEYDPAQLADLIWPIVRGEADVVFGSRYAAGAPDGPRWQTTGNRWLTGLSNWFTGLRLTDMETGYKALRGDLARRLAPELRESGFGIEPELTARLARLPGVRVAERPIRYSGRGYADGKKIGFSDGLWALCCIVRYGRQR